ASQLFGRSVAYFFHPLRITVKKYERSSSLNMFQDERLQFFSFITVSIDSRNPLPFRRLPAEPPRR
ncbi:hypothetical protein ACQKML_23725, partial [Peribacillus frigoritolerans]